MPLLAKKSNDNLQGRFPIGRRVRVEPSANPDILRAVGKEFIVIGYDSQAVYLSTAYTFGFPAEQLTLLPLEVGRDIHVGKMVTVNSTMKDTDGFVSPMRSYLGKSGEIESIREINQEKFIKLKNVPFFFHERSIIPMVNESDIPRRAWVRLKTNIDGVSPWLNQARGNLGLHPHVVVDNFIFLSIDSRRAYPAEWFDLLPSPPEKGWVQIKKGKSKDGIGWVPQFDPLVGTYKEVHGKSKVYGSSLKGINAVFHPDWLRVIENLPATFPVGTPVKICDQPPQDDGWRPFMDVLCGQKSHVIATEPPAFMRLAIAPEVLFTSEWATSDQFDAQSITDSIVRDLRERMTV